MSISTAAARPTAARQPNYCPKRQQQCTALLLLQDHVSWALTRAWMSRMSGCEGMRSVSTAASGSRQRKM